MADMNAGSPKSNSPVRKGRERSSREVLHRAVRWSLCAGVSEGSRMDMDSIAAARRAWLV